MLMVGCLLQPLLAFVYWTQLKPYLTWAHHRVVDVTLFPSPVRWSLVDAYVAHTIARETKPLVLVMGDSEPYGLHVEDNLTFSHLLAERLPDYAVFNLSFIDGRFTDMEQVIDSLIRHNVHPAFVIFDINITHFFGPRESHPHDPNVVLVSPPLPLWAAVAAATLPNVQQVFRVKENRPVIRPDTFEYVPLPKDYLPRIASPLFDHSFSHLLDKLNPLGGKIVAYMAPYAVESFAHYGFDESAFRRLSAGYTGICRKSGVRCLDLSETLTLDDFIDIIHLNRQGHALLAQRLQEEIVKTSSKASRVTATSQLQNEQ